MQRQRQTRWPQRRKELRRRRPLLPPPVPMPPQFFPPPPPRLRLARAKIGRRNAASLALFGSSLGFAKTGGSDFFEEDHLELELFVAAAARGEEEKGENSRETRLTLCPQLARVGEYAVVGEVERGEDSAAGVVAS